MTKEAKIPTWFWLAVSLGAIIRIYLAVFTDGTADVRLWQRHARGVGKWGVVGYYQTSTWANHPPVILRVEAWLLKVSNATGIAFRTLLRLPFAILDAGTTALLLSLWREKRWRFALAAGYWLHPLAMIFSAYHGNTDSAVPFFLLLSVCLLGRGNVIAAGIALGAGMWIKIPGVLAIPALLLVAQDWRKQAIFLLTMEITAFATYVPAMLQDPGVVSTNIFGYRGQLIATLGDDPIWGWRVLLSMCTSTDWRAKHLEQIQFVMEHQWMLSMGLLLLITFLRRQRRSVHDVCGTIGMCYTVFYAFNDHWAWQYFAWAVPFWFFLPKWFLVGSSVLASGYVYSLYWLLCGNPWLLGTWQWAQHPHWPTIVELFRDAAVLFLFLSACWFLVSEGRRCLRRRAQVDSSNEGIGAQ